MLLCVRGCVLVILLLNPSWAFSLGLQQLSVQQFELRSYQDNKLTTFLLQVHSLWWSLQKSSWKKNNFDLIEVYRATIYLAVKLHISYLVPSQHLFCCSRICQNQGPHAKSNPRSCFIWPQRVTQIKIVLWFLFLFVKSSHDGWQTFKSSLFFSSFGVERATENIILF